MSVLRSKGGISRSSEDTLKSLFHSFDQKTVAVVKPVPKWDLGLVLSVLKGAPFEPLSGASLEHLTYKTIFLLSLATGARRGELLALRRGNYVKPKKDGSCIFLHPDPHFVPKCRRARMEVQPIELFAFSQKVTKSDKDYLLCPVRSLRYYLDRTSNVHIEKGRKKLLLPFNLDNVNELSPAGLSRMFVKTVQTCYEFIDPSLVDDFNIHIHQARLLSHSLAKAASVPLERILQSGHWKNQSTFAEFYLKSLVIFSDNLHSLGPIAAAGNVVQSVYRF
jgi:hypothetical protein